MTLIDAVRARQTRLVNLWHARRAARVHPATGLVSQPEPKSIGSFARGRQLVAGNCLFAGHLIETDGRMIWEIDAPDAAFEDEIHGFAWLDDLAAVGDAPARQLAQQWLLDWIARYGRGSGPGWTPDLAGRRLFRWTSHAMMLLRGMDAEASEQMFRSLAQQTVFVSRRWQAASDGLPRFEALMGLVYAGLSLTGLEAHIGPARKALAAECTRQIDATGGIATRNPEHLLEILSLLTWAAEALEDGAMPVEDSHRDAIQQIAATLRVLRHADGGLARFHGGGRGLDGRLDQALSLAGAPSTMTDTFAMGYARLSGGRSTVILDAAPPPKGAASVNGHASTLAFELTSGRRPVIVNCGAGTSFGADWQRAGRATPSHSTLGLAGVSSAQLGPQAEHRGHLRELLVGGPRRVPHQLNQGRTGPRFEGGHDGYLDRFGLTHVRQLELSADGRTLDGEDTLACLEAADQKRFDKVLDGRALEGVPFAVRFHLHAEVDVALDMGGNAVSLALKSGEIWVFRHDGTATMTLDPSVYLEKGRLQPRASQQIVLSAKAVTYATRVCWSLAKAQDTPNSIRDVWRDDPALPE
ncbi:heparinase II/III family protein [Cognatishimia sp. MH4019]|uniref:heparinase II/III family protein n=1 Tax=Cognatishimia sp. MH4019 TaxID=2854030 RepID=UPI001CD55597